MKLKELKIIIKKYQKRNLIKLQNLKTIKNIKLKFNFVEKTKLNNIKLNNIKIKTSKGITVLALTITIIILLILSGITIVGITGENGLIQNAGKAKQETEIANEKEILERATARSDGTRFKRKCKRRNITK